MVKSQLQHVSHDEDGRLVLNLQGVTSEQAVRELVAWLTHMHERTLEDASNKAIEYGSKDLTFMGHGIESIMVGKANSKLPPEILACWLYALGKMSRLSGALERGELPSADTWYDLHVYALMALKIQETGTWL